MAPATEEEEEEQPAFSSVVTSIDQASRPDEEKYPGDASDDADGKTEQPRKPPNEVTTVPPVRPPLTVSSADPSESTTAATLFGPDQPLPTTESEPMSSADRLEVTPAPPAASTVETTATTAADSISSAAPDHSIGVESSSTAASVEAQVTENFSTTVAPIEAEGIESTTAPSQLEGNEPSTEKDSMTTTPDQQEPSESTLFTTDRPELMEFPQIPSQLEMTKSPDEPSISDQSKSIEETTKIPELDEITGQLMTESTSNQPPVLDQSKPFESAQSTTDNPELTEFEEIPDQLTTTGAPLDAFDYDLDDSVVTTLATVVPALPEAVEVTTEPSQGSTVTPIVDQSEFIESTTMSDLDTKMELTTMKISDSSAEVDVTEDSVSEIHQLESMAITDPERTTSADESIAMETTTAAFSDNSEEVSTETITELSELVEPTSVPTTTEQPESVQSASTTVTDKPEIMKTMSMNIADPSIEAQPQESRPTISADDSKLTKPSATANKANKATRGPSVAGSVKEHSTGAVKPLKKKNVVKQVITGSMFSNKKKSKRPVAKGWRLKSINGIEIPADFVPPVFLAKPLRSLGLFWPESVASPGAFVPIAPTVIVNSQSAEASSNSLAPIIHSNGANDSPSVAAADVPRRQTADHKLPESAATVPSQMPAALVEEKDINEGKEGEGRGGEETRKTVATTTLPMESAIVPAAKAAVVDDGNGARLSIADHNLETMASPVSPTPIKDVVMDEDSSPESGPPPPTAATTTTAATTAVDMQTDSQSSGVDGSDDRSSQAIGLATGWPTSIEDVRTADRTSLTVSESVESLGASPTALGDLHDQRRQEQPEGPLDSGIKARSKSANASGNPTVTLGDTRREKSLQSLLQQLANSGHQEVALFFQVADAHHSHQDGHDEQTA